MLGVGLSLPPTVPDRWLQSTFLRESRERVPSKGLGGRVSRALKESAHVEPQR